MNGVCDAHIELRDDIREIKKMLTTAISDRIPALEINVEKLTNLFHSHDDRITKHKEERVAAIEKIVAEVSEQHKVLFEGNGDPSLVSAIRELSKYVKNKKDSTHSFWTWAYRIAMGTMMTWALTKAMEIASKLHV